MVKINKADILVNQVTPQNITKKGLEQGQLFNTDSFNSIHCFETQNLVDGLLDMDGTSEIHNGANKITFLNSETDIKIAQGLDHDIIKSQNGDYGIQASSLTLIDKGKDIVLRNIIKTIIPVVESKNNTSEKIKVMAFFIRFISQGSNIDAANRLRGVNYLGQVFEKRGAVCRDVSVMFKILCDEVGIKNLVQKGFLEVEGNKVRHAWNEILVGNEWFIIDIAQGKIEPSQYQESINKYYTYDSQQKEYIQHK